MKLTKYAHACVVLEMQGKKLVIDPGGFTPDFGETANIVAVVITHVHGDHFSPAHLDTIFKANPKAELYTTQEVADQYKRPNTTVAAPGQTATAGPFTLHFSGTLHKLIHPSMPQPQNTAVMVNDTFFYPGDSFTMPEQPVAVLAVPANAPWAAMAESMDYLSAVKPKRCFPTHNGLLSDNGNTIYNFGLNHAAEAAGTTFTFLQPGESLEL